MPKIKYQDFNFRAGTLELITTANKIIAEYQAQGYDLTLRQLYYQFVARDIIPNSPASYNKLGTVVNDARLAGMIDWEAIVDRTRELRTLSHWDDPSSIVEDCSKQFNLDLWDKQPFRCECFTPDTPLIIRGVPVEIAAAQVGDRAFTHFGRFQSVTKIIRTRYRGKMLSIKAAGLLPVKVTPSHPFWAQACEENSKRKGSERRFSPSDWVTSESLKKFDYVQVPLLSQSERRSVLNNEIKILGGVRSVKYKFQLDSDALKVCGLYLAEGSVRADKRTIQFTFNVMERNYARIILNWAEKVGIPSSTAFGRGSRVVYLYSKALADWFSEEFGTGSHVKVIPEWLMFAMPEEQLVLLEYYFRGDGTFSDPTRSALAATTRSSWLAQQVQLIFLWAKYVCILNTTMDHGELRWDISVTGASAARLAPLWRIDIPPKGLGRSGRYNHVRFTEEYACFPVRKIESFDYDGFVFNLEVEKDHSYCVPVAVHNCWIEKDALVGVFERVCRELDVPLFSCRGYTSQSEMWVAGQRMLQYKRNKQTPVIFHFGDHDPSGKDMSRDIVDRIELFTSDKLRFERLALNMDQVRQYNPPPNPAKITDSRSDAYIAEFGGESWELDALEPNVLAGLVRAAVAKVVDNRLMAAEVKAQREHRETLALVADKFEEVKEFVRA